MSKIGIFRDYQCRLHHNSQFHPESPQRLVAVEAAIQSAIDLQPVLCPLPERVATLDELCTLHSADYVERIVKAGERALAGGERFQLDEDTFMSAGSLAAARLAAGAGFQAVSSVWKFGTGCFVLVRPPGHHALAERAMGFCLFNNVALAAEYAVTDLGYKRVLIVDWDVHHGNGTQALHYYNPQVLLISLQQHPLWCHTGWFTEDGAGEGKGYNVNIPLPAATGDQGYLSAWRRIVRPVAAEYQPDLILLSAGYDAHKLDPVGGQKVSTTGFALLAAELLDLSRLAGAPVVGFLEGGYNPQALAESVVATLRVLSTDSEQQLAQVLAPYKEVGTTGDQSPELVNTYIEAVRRHYAQFWRSLRTQPRAT